MSVTIMNDRYIGSGQPRGYGYVEMPSKTAGANAIAEIEGKRLGNRDISVVEALPLSDKGRTVPRNTMNNGRFYKDRKRQ